MTVEHRSNRPVRGGFDRGEDGEGDRAAMGSLSHQIHRPHRLSVPPTSAVSLGPSSSSSTSSSTSGHRLPFPAYFPPSTPAATPSKQRAPSMSYRKLYNKNSLQLFFFLLFFLRSLYTISPFLRSSPPLIIFPCTFMVSLLSFLLNLAFSIIPPSARKDPFQVQKKNQPAFSLSSIPKSQQKLFILKSVLLASVFLIRFQALAYCGVASMILAEVSGNLTARFIDDRKNPRIRGLVALLAALLLLIMGWDRIECFPGRNCLKLWQMLLPFTSGFLGFHERYSSQWRTIKHLGSKRIGSVTLFYTTLLLSPSCFLLFLYPTASLGILTWRLANTAFFGVLLSITRADDENSRSSTIESLATIAIALSLELMYVPEISFRGLFLCALPLTFFVGDLGRTRNSHNTSPPPSSSLCRNQRKSRKIALFLAINATYMIVEFVTGLMSNSLGLISDACHMLFDCAALAIGLHASYVSRLPANDRYHYGHGRFEALSGYANSVFLVLVGALIILESVERILDPREISTGSLLAVSVGGLLVNVIGLIFFREEHHHDHDHHHEHHHHDHDHHHEHHHHDHNMEGIFLHVLADTLGSVGVVVSTLLIRYGGWVVADPISSLFISVLIISSVLPLLRNSAEVLLQRAPRGELGDVIRKVRKVEGVAGVRSFHVWTLTGVHLIGTLNLSLSPDADRVSVRRHVADLFARNGVRDLTLQLC